MKRLLRQFYLFIIVGRYIHQFNFIDHWYKTTSILTFIKLHFDKDDSSLY